MLRAIALARIAPGYFPASLIPLELPSNLRNAVDQVSEKVVRRDLQTLTTIRELAGPRNQQ